MASNTNDVFKFVAVRPVQLASDDDTRIDVLRDPRVADARALTALVKAAAAIGSPAAALRRWADTDLSPFRPLAAGRQRLVQDYTALDADAPPPVAAELIAAAGLGDVDPGDQATVTGLWDAVYLAHASGPDAGGRNDVPTAALRALHFLSLASDDPSPERDLALRALRAKLAVAPELDAVLRPRTPGRSTPDSAAPASPAVRPSADDLDAARTLLQSVVDTRALRDRVMTTAATSAPVMSRGTVSSVGSFSQQRVTVAGSRGIGALLGTDPEVRSARVLDAAGVGTDDAVPAATAKLDTHLAALTTEAATRSTEPGFRAALAELVDRGELQLPVPMPSGSPAPAPVDPSTAPDVDVHGRITPLGIGDLKVVKQTLLAYEPGEVAYIENVLTGESRARVVRALQRSQTTLLTSTEQTQDTERDTTTTDRFELKREADNTIKEDMSIKAGLQVTASYGPIVARATGDFAYSTSKEQSEKTSSDFAHDVVDRSVTKVEIKTTTTRTTTTLDENEQTDTHTIDNSAGDHHVVGVYRWVDKRYRAQVYNYGTRLMLEFVVPEPAAFYAAARLGRPVTVDATPPAPFVNDLNLVLPPARHGRLAASDLDDTNYQQYAARYGATGVTAPPPLWKYVSAAVEKDSLDDGKSIAVTSKDFVVPDGYTLADYDIAVSVLWVNHPKLTVAFGDSIHNIIDHEDGGFSALVTSPATTGGTTSGLSVAPVNGPVPISVAAYDVHAFAANVQGTCLRDAATYTTWQLQTYDKIAAAYQALQQVYDQKVAAAKQAAEDAHVVGHNPDINRATEQTELKKLCITMMTGQHFSQFHAVTEPPDAPTHHPEIDVVEAMAEGPIVQFFEQAFEWEQMTYLFYPYFWGRKSSWVDRMTSDDPDPLFATFLTAGSCRVVVPVPVAYVDAVLYLLQSPAPDLGSRVWRGGDAPTLDSDLYVSIAQEFRKQTDDLAGATPEGDPWEFTLPTSLIWLQQDGTLPTFA